MADTFKYVAGQDFYLAGSGVTSSATSITLKSFTFPNSGDNITMTDFGTIGYGTLEPGTGRREFISWTGVTQNANGTATLTGITRGLQPKAPYTTDSAYQTGHAGNALFRVTNAPKFYDELSGKDNDETVTGVWTFTDTAVPRMDTAHTYLAGEEEYFATKRYVDGVAISGVADANTTTKGAIEIATDSELSSGAAAASGDTSADLVAHAASFNETAAAGKVPVGDSNGKIGSDWGGNANTLATLDGSSKVVQDPANATSTPTASKIPIYDSNADLLVPTTPTDNNAATSKSYVDGSISADSLVFYIAGASDNLKQSADTEELNENATSFTLQKEMQTRVPGTIRIKFDLRSAVDGRTVSGIIYKNGAAVGTTRSTTSNTYITYSEDLTFEINDLIQIYVQEDGSAGSGVYLRNFRAYFDLVEGDALVVTNS